jgi:hypothetical protein
MRRLAQERDVKKAGTVENKSFPVRLSDCPLIVATRQRCVIRKSMIRLLSIALAILIGTALPAKPQDCCDPAAPGQCHHSRAPRHDSPCRPTFSACPDDACLTEQRTTVSLSANLQRATRDASTLALPPIWLRPRTSLEQVSVGCRPRDRAQSVRLFLLNRVFVI